jgi:hypothetical protein
VKNGLGYSPSPTVHKLLELENDAGLGPRYSLRMDAVYKLGFDVKILGSKLLTLLSEIKSSGGTIVGYGAPAKATTLMYEFGLGLDVLDFIVDDSPLKQGLYTPGKKVPIFPTSAIREKRPTHIFILAWNFADSIVRSNTWFSDMGGKFIVPLPNLMVI